MKPIANALKRERPSPRGQQLAEEELSLDAARRGPLDHMSERVARQAKPCSAPPCTRNPCFSEWFQNNTYTSLPRSQLEHTPSTNAIRTDLEQNSLGVQVPHRCDQEQFERRSSAALSPTIPLDGRRRVMQLQAAEVSNAFEYWVVFFTTKIFPC